MLVYTSLYGGYDTPKPPRPHPGVAEWRLYTDDRSLYAPGWKVVVEERSFEWHPRMQAKWRKCHPPIDHDTSLYLDASIRLRDPKLLEHAVNMLTAGATWCMYPHPERTTIQEELLASIGMAKYRGLEQAMRDQVEAYSKLSMRWADVRLWAGGIVGRRHTKDVLRAGSDWYGQCARWTYQDQLSLPIVLTRHRIFVTAMHIGGGLWNNPHFTVEPHRSDR